MRLPWPSPRRDTNRSAGVAPRIVGWRSTSWEASFARLLTLVAGHSDFRSPTEEVAASILLEQRHPLDK